MDNKKRRLISVHLSEQKTIVDLSRIIHQFQSEIYLKKIVNGSIIEVNLKSFLGLITLQLKNKDEIEVIAIGEDALEAIDEVEQFFFKN